jgi:hypothetical protein
MIAFIEAKLTRNFMLKELILYLEREMILLRSRMEVILPSFSRQNIHSRTQNHFAFEIQTIFFRKLHRTRQFCYAQIYIERSN